MPIDDELFHDWLPSPGEVIAGKYVVETVIGHGGMGCVVAARHQQLEHRVAIKYLRDAVLGQRDAVERFLREARAVVAIKSEHVAKVLDVGTFDNGAPYLVMELLEGRDLGAVLDQDGPIPVECAVSYLLQVCEALAEAHARGIVHRDLKPANLFLSQRADGSPLVKVLDFGIAKALKEEAGDEIKPALTSTGVALGTPIYMSPEQIRDAKRVDQRADVWGLGLTLYELLIGAPPFLADTMQALCAKIVVDPIEPMTSRSSDIPVELDAVVARCLEKNREHRYQTVAELARDLAPFATPSSQILVDRIVRIVEGTASAPTASQRWSPDDSFGDTVLPSVTATPLQKLKDSGEQVSTVFQTSSSAARSSKTVLLIPAVLAAMVVATGVLVFGVLRNGEPARASSLAEPKPASSANGAPTAQAPLPAPASAKPAAQDPPRPSPPLAISTHVRIAKPAATAASASATAPPPPPSATPRPIAEKGDLDERR